MTTDVERLSGDFRPSPERDFKDAKVPVHFNVVAGGAQNVSVAGRFNHCDPKGTPLKKAGEM